MRAVQPPPLAQTHGELVRRRYSARESSRFDSPGRILLPSSSCSLTKIKGPMHDAVRPMLDATTSGSVAFGDWQTWYRITGDLGSGLTPLLAAQGGPGCTHDYLLTIADVARTGRPVVHYDQIGNGRSTHLRDRGPDFWTVDLFVAELCNLVEKLGIGGGYHLLGQSWGGMLGAEHAIRRPTGLR